MSQQLHLFKKPKIKSEDKQKEFDARIEERLKYYNNLLRKFK